jgi:hypothetical protein
MKLRLADEQAEPSINLRKPIRLFVVDSNSRTFGVISATPDTHTLENAMGEFLFAETVLEFELEPYGESVRYTAGWSAAAYDWPYSLWVAEIPET